MTRNRIILFASLAALGLGLLWATGVLRAPRADKAAESSQKVDAAGADGLVKLSPEQIAAARIETAPVAAGGVAQRLVVPAAIKTDPDHLARVAAKVAGSVFELKKRLGDQVAANEVVAILESREVADAKSEYLAANVNYDLQTALFQREKGLFEKKITAEQLFLRAKTSFAEAKLKLDLARQKLAALDLSEQEIAALPTQPISALRRKDIRAPLAGRIIERLVSLGQPVGGEGQMKEIFVIADLSVVEADLAVPAAQLSSVREGQPIRLVNAEGRAFEGVVTAVSGVITPETRSGHVVARFPNPDFSLRPGSLFDAEIAVKETRARIRVPRAAVQTVDNAPAVFVRTPHGFERRRIEIGAGDADWVEATSGLTAGETIAVTNTFLLKAELGKGDIPQE